MDVIEKITGGFALKRETLSRDGKLTLSFGKVKYINPEIINRAFEEAEQAKPLPKDTKYEMGCCQTLEGISKYYIYKNKDFTGTPLLNQIFSGYEDIQNEDNQNEDNQNKDIEKAIENSEESPESEASENTEDTKNSEKSENNKDNKSLKDIKNKKIALNYQNGINDNFLHKIYKSYFTPFNICLIILVCIIGFYFLRKLFLSYI